MKIERDIPMPEGRSLGPRSPLTIALSQMEPGDSVESDDYPKAAYEWARRQGRRVKVRAQSGGRYRVWLVQ